MGDVDLLEPAALVAVLPSVLDDLEEVYQLHDIPPIAQNTSAIMTIARTNATASRASSFTVTMSPILCH